MLPLTGMQLLGKTNNEEIDHLITFFSTSFTHTA